MGAAFGLIQHAPCTVPGHLVLCPCQELLDDRSNGRSDLDQEIAGAPANA
jgi:hypothetical protein